MRDKDMRLNILCLLRVRNIALALVGRDRR